MVSLEVWILILLSKKNSEKLIGDDDALNPIFGGMRKASEKMRYIFETIDSYSKKFKKVPSFATSAISHSRFCLFNWSPCSRLGSNVNGTTGNFPFPQNKDNPYGFHSSIYNNADILAAYNKWYSSCITSSGAGGFLRIQRPDDSGLNLNSTVSEGIGYAMVIAVYMNDENLSITFGNTNSCIWTVPMERA